ncbi:hypothetical protein GB937_010413 [Aspergillus fischeri]|nr:hypothetical protein GB937_010413 [Aspergillus fischeri]
MANSSTQPSRSSRPRGSLGSKSYQKLHRPNAEAADATDADSTQPQTQPDSQPQSHTSASPAPGRKSDAASLQTAELAKSADQQPPSPSTTPTIPRSSSRSRSTKTRRRAHALLLPARQRHGRNRQHP